MQDTIKKYLDHYAEPEAVTVEADEFDSTYGHVLVVPAYDEPLHQLLGVWRRIRTKFLAIIVINAPETGHAGSKLLYNALQHQGHPRNINAKLLIVEADDGPDMLLVNRFDDHIAPRQGVGLARKIGADIALALINQGVVDSDLMHFTDADATLPGNYFEPRLPPDAAAAVYSFNHVAEPWLQLPALVYEIRILYYAAGLGWAGSPYAFTTIGSTISCTAGAYAKVRGFPKRNAGEDFYLLNKLRKVGTIHTIGDATITIMARPSTRVPMGTGRAIMAIRDLPDPLADPGCYHPDCFAALKSILDAIARGTAEEEIPFSSLIGQYMEDSGFGEVLTRVPSRNPATRVKFLHDWFDAKRTLKFVHFIRDALGPTGSLPFSGIMQAPFVDPVDTGRKGPCARALRDHLHNRLFTNAGE